MPRKTLSPRQAIRVWVKTRGRCAWCGVALTPDAVVFDHIMPIALGGDSGTNNLVAACRRCNSWKADFHPRVAELWLKRGMHKCQAIAAWEWESGRRDKPDYERLWGHEFLVRSDGTRELIPVHGVVCSPCDLASCPECEFATSDEEEDAAIG